MVATQTQPEVLASLEDILAIDDIESVVLPIAEWGGRAVRVRGVSRREHHMALKHSTDKQGNTDNQKVEALLIGYGLVEPKIDQAGYEQLALKNTGALQRIISKIMQLSGLTEAETKEAEATFPE